MGWVYNIKIQGNTATAKDHICIGFSMLPVTPNKGSELKLDCCLRQADILLRKAADKAET